MLKSIAVSQIRDRPELVAEIEDLSPRYCALALERCARYGIEVIHRSKDTRIECLPSPSDPTS